MGLSFPYASNAVDGSQLLLIILSHLLNSPKPYHELVELEAMTEEFELCNP